MGKLELSLAVGDYDHTRDIASGDVRAEGIEITALRLPIEELLYRLHNYREWDVSELGISTHAVQTSRDRSEMVGLPVFTSRTFRHAAIYIRSDAGIASPAGLAGKRIGIPQWSMTAAIYARALLAHSYGVDLKSIDWVQAGVNEPGRTDKLQIRPEGYSITPCPERSISDMLLRGELDAAISARAPAAFELGDGRIRRVFEDPGAEELAYWQSTRVFPIMHMIVIRRDVYERNRWIARNLFQAFETAKERSLARLREVAASHFPLPWLPNHVALAREQLGEDFWPYGIEPNRNTLEAFCRFAYEQGCLARPLEIEELFAPEVQGKWHI